MNQVVQPRKEDCASRSHRLFRPFDYNMRDCSPSRWHPTLLELLLTTQVRSGSVRRPAGGTLCIWSSHLPRVQGSHPRLLRVLPWQPSESSPVSHSLVNFVEISRHRFLENSADFRRSCRSVLTTTTSSEVCHVREMRSKSSCLIPVSSNSRLSEESLDETPDQDYVKDSSC